MIKHWLVFSLALFSASLMAAKQCPQEGVAVQVLGSGGPIADDGRASSAYLVWKDGRARVLVDIGGGSFVRFGQSGAQLEDLDAVLLTHLHTDHVTDLPALLKGGFFSNRQRALPLVGPSAGDLGLFPGIGEFMQGSFNRETGTYRYLFGVLDGSDGMFEVPANEVVISPREVQGFTFADDIQVKAVGVAHGAVPALGFRVELGGVSIAFTGDQSADNADFAAMVEGVDMLVAHLPIPEPGGPIARRLHRSPKQVGDLAAQSGTQNLVLSHLMARSLRDLPANLTAVRSRYAHKLTVAEDLDCFAVP